MRREESLPTGIPVSAASWFMAFPSVPCSLSATRCSSADNSTKSCRWMGCILRVLRLSSVSQPKASSTSCAEVMRWA